MSRSVFWNTLLLPLITLLTAATSILIRRRFGLGSGVYDILIGVGNTVLYYSSLGIPTSLSKFLPELEARGGRPAVLLFLRRAAAARMAVLAVVLVGLNVWAEPLAGWLALGPGGAFFLRLLTALIVARALYELVIKTLQALLVHLWVNLVTLAQAVLEPTFIAVALFFGFGIGGVLGALAMAATLLLPLGCALVGQALKRASSALGESGSPTELPDEARPELSGWNAEAPSSGAAPQAAPLWRFSIFTYVFELSLYLAGPAFAKPALAAVLGRPEPVALFSTGYQVAFMVCGFVVSGFRGVYRPMFAHLRAAGDEAQLRRAFDVVSKVQLGLLVPIGVGLIVMVADYLPLLYGPDFSAAVTVTRILVTLLFAETALNLGIIILSIDERYRAVLAAQAVLLVSAPLFLWAASRGGVLAAASVLGVSRVAVVWIGYLISRRLYGVRFPWRFLGRLGIIAAVMAAVLATGRALWPSSWLEAATLTALGVLVFVAGVRLARIIGPAEVDLLRRSRIPGHDRWLRWLAPAVPTRGRS